MGQCLENGNENQTTYTQAQKKRALPGFLVGFGTRLGSGCTSGHGICGMSRLSKRSIIATITFMFAGFITVYIVRHLMEAL